MKDFHEYLPESAIEENLKENAAKMDRLTEQERSHLRELALEIMEDLEGHPDWLGSLPDNSPPTFVSSPSPIPHLQNALNQNAILRAARQSVYLCMELRQSLEERELLSPAFFFPDLEQVSQRSQCRVACQRSSFADEAYLQFCKHLNDPRISYTHSFLAACEDVYNGVCDFCILPVESALEGHLNSFSKLIERYELKIVMTCDVSEGAADKATRYALLSRQMCLAPKGRSQSFFDFSIPLEQSPSAALLLMAAELCGMRLYRMDSLATNEPHRFSLRVILHADGADLYAFLLFLAMVAPHYDPIGIYPHITVQPNRKEL